MSGEGAKGVSSTTTFTVTSSQPETNFAVGPDYVARARAENEEFRELNAEVIKRLNGVRFLLGDTVHDALHRPIERLVDTAIDCQTSYERALRAGADALLKATADATARIFELQSDRMSDERAWIKQTGRLHELLRLATDDVADRYKRSRKPLPAWFDDARNQIDPPFRWARHSAQTTCSGARTGRSPTSTRVTSPALSRR